MLFPVSCCNCQRECDGITAKLSITPRIIAPGPEGGGWPVSQQNAVILAGIIGGKKARIGWVQQKANGGAVAASCVSAS
jgi:hypothetical protein